MKRTIFLGLTVAAVAAMLVVTYSGLLQDADATIRESKKDRANKVLDKHIAAGGEHGEKAQKIKDRLNNGNSNPSEGNG
jgi:archaellin